MPAQSQALARWMTSRPGHHYMHAACAAQHGLHHASYTTAWQELGFHAHVHTQVFWAVSQHVESCQVEAICGTPQHVQPCRHVELCQHTVLRA